MQPLEPGAFHGRILGARGSGGFRLTETSIEPGRRLPRHSHERAFFCLLVGGGYEEDYGSRAVAYRPFTVAFHPPGEAHRCEIAPSGARFFHVELSPDWLEEAGFRTSGPFSDLRGGELAWLATRLLREYRDGLAGPPIASEALVLEMLELAGGSATGPTAGAAPPRWLPRAVDYLESEFRRSVRVAEVAREVGTHPAHLSRVFRARIGMPVGEYVHRLRLRYAAERLGRPGARAADVAADAGFADQSHMTRVFRRLTGFTPRGVVSP